MPQPRRGWSGEGVAAEEVDVVVLEWGEAGEEFVGFGEAVGGEPFDGGLDVLHSTTAFRARPRAPS
nr:hypothetical protein [Streptomyces sp. NA02950]